MNLIRNPSFEHWMGRVPATVYDADDNPTERTANELSAPDGWRVWFREFEWVDEFGNVIRYGQPEVQPINLDQRVMYGTAAVKFFTFQLAHDGGLMQTVDVPGHGPVTVFTRSTRRWNFKHNDAYKDEVALTIYGDTLTFGYHAHAWSSHGIPDPATGTHAVDNGRWSVWAGFKPFSDYEVNVPPPTGNDPWVDGARNAVFSAGVDLTGGMNPLAPTVQWGRCRVIYNNYEMVICHAKLSTPDPPPEPPPDPDRPRGYPREQYARTYVLLPPGASVRWARYAVGGTWPENDGDEGKRYTIGGSADDAGIGALDSKRVLAVNPHLWPGTLSLKDFFTTYYPGTEYVPVLAATPAELARKLKEL